MSQILCFITFLLLKQNIWPKQFQGRRAYFGSQFVGIQSSIKGRHEEECEVADHIASKLKEQIERNVCTQLARAPTHQMMPSNVRVCLPP